MTRWRCSVSARGRAGGWCPIQSGRDVYSAWVPQDDETVLFSQWYRRAADWGTLRPKCNLEKMYDEGRCAAG
ncbi:MAG: hypothetical protein ACYYK0_01655 [Candidatus Eutrophobiaceae bacterium]